MTPLRRAPALPPHLTCFHVEKMWKRRHEASRFNYWHPAADETQCVYFFESLLLLLPTLSSETICCHCTSSASIHELQPHDPRLAVGESTGRAHVPGCMFLRSEGARCSVLA